MENRFGFKDLIFSVLFVIVIVLVVLAMFQYDRQYEHVTTLRRQAAEQTRELTEISRQLAGMRRLMEQGVPMAAAPHNQGNEQAVEPGVDAFRRIRDAQGNPDYARGDWLIDSFAVNVAKVTPLVSGDVYASIVQGFVLESLAERDPETLEWVPLVARSWEISEDGLTITFQMRPDVVFSDGRPLTADDLAFTYEWIMNPEVEAPRQRASLQMIQSVEATGPHEVVFTFREPYFRSFELAAGMWILPRHFYSQFTPEQFNRSTGLLMGSGPYRLESPTDWSPGRLIQLVPNERYWGETGAFDRLVFREINEDVARLTTFRNGEIDVFGATPEQYRQLLRDSRLVERTHQFEYETMTAGYNYIAWNQRRRGTETWFADPRVRLAMTLLTDRQRIAEEIWLGYATPASGPFHRLGQQADPEIQPWPYDPDRAIEMLREAGFRRRADGMLVGPEGRPFRFRLTYPTGNAETERMVLFLRDSYARAGIALEPDPLDWSIFGERLTNRDFDAITLGWTGGIETDIYQMYHSDQMADGGDNFIHYQNTELDSLIDQARRTVNEEERMPLWRQAHRILHEEQPYTFLLNRMSLSFIDQRIENVQKLPLGLNPRLEWYVPREEQRWTE